MNKLRVLGLPGDIARGQLPTAGQKEPIGPCGYYRVKCPFRVLEEQGLADVEYGTWPDIGQVIQFCKQGVYDVLVLQRQSSVWQRLLVTKAHDYGVATVYDTDDMALSLSPQNPMYALWGDNRKLVWRNFQRLNRQHKVDPRIVAKWTEADVWRTAQSNRMNYRWMLSNADLVTVSTPYIADSYREFSGNISVLPNMIDERDWADVKPQRMSGTDGYTVLGWAGGESHAPDLKMLVRPLAQLFAQWEDVLLLLVGWPAARDLFPREMQARVQTIEWAPIDEYRDWVAGFDIGLAPAVVMPTNKAKSSIRVYELALAGVPVIASPVPYSAGVHDGMGQLVNKPIGWKRAVTKYLEDPGLAAVCAEELKRHVLAEHTYTQNAWRWLEAYELAVDIRRRDVN